MANPRDTAKGNMLALVRLKEDSDVGLISVGVTGRVATHNPLINGPETPGKEVVELWVTIALGQPLALGGVHIEEVPFRMIGHADVDDLIKAFMNMKEARAKAAPSLIVT